MEFKIKNRDLFQKKITGILFSLPALILIFIFLILPTFMAFRNSFYDYYALKPNDKLFIGLKNYFELYKDKTFLLALKNTFYFTVVVVPVQTTIALLLAVLVNQKLKLSKVYRIGFFSPVITSMVVISILWTYLYNPNNGLINSILNSFKIPSQPFLTSISQAMNSIIVMSAWQAAGYYMMIFLAGLQEISNDLYEAAEMDGANEIHKFLYVTLPSLSNVLRFVILMTTVQAFKLFTQPFIMTNGGPQDSTKTVVQFIYEQGFQYRNIGYSSAISVIFFIFVLLISMILRKIIFTKEESGG